MCGECRAERSAEQAGASRVDLRLDLFARAAELRVEARVDAAATQARNRDGGDEGRGKDREASRGHCDDESGRDDSLRYLDASGRARRM